MSVFSKVKDAVKAETQAEPPKTFLDKIITSTPVVMTVVATILAGLSSSEMSTAQYHRSMAAQNQSKAGDQWAFYQAKRMRQANAENALDVLPNMGTGTELSPDWLQKNASDLANAAVEFEAAGRPANVRIAADAKSLSQQWNQALADPMVLKALHFLAGSDLPRVSEKSIEDPDVQAALAAIKDDKPDTTETSRLIRKVNGQKFEESMAAAQANALAFDAATKPMQPAIDRIGKLVALQTVLARRIRREMGTAPFSSATTEAATRVIHDPADSKGIAAALAEQTDDLGGDFAAARLRYTARRYTAESGYNMAIAQLYELDVHRSGSASDRHRDRSRDFFYGMLGAQAAVTIATLSLAVKNRSILWTFATVAGTLAVASGIYVYLFT